MKLYFASPFTSLGLINKYNCKCLSSFVECKKKNLLLIKNEDFFLDSGAYSVFMGTIKNIDIDEYIDFIKKNNIKIYAGLDVIGNAEQTYKNCKYMINQNLCPIPTFHYGSDFKWLEKYKKEFKYIAIGGMAGGLKRKRIYLKKFLNKVFSIIKSDARLHGFGLTSNLLKEYPFYSVDSTGWISSGKHRSVTYFKKGRIGMYEALTKPAYNKNKLEKKIFGDYKITNKACCYLYELSIIAYLEFERYITNLWEARGIKWD